MSDICPVEHAGSIGPLLQLAIRSAKVAGEIVSGGATRRNTIEQKGVGDLVSDVDREADRVACELLRSESDLPILSEELNADQEPTEDMWIVDPLDGSGAFLMAAGPQYPSVLIALRQGGETQVGVCHFPLTGDWFYAQKGRAAWFNGKRLVCDSNESLSEVWVEMNQYGDAAYETDYFADLRTRLRSADGARMVTSNFPHAGVAMHIARATNSLAAIVHDNNPDSLKQGPWDIAAPQLILEEAGGVFLNPKGERTNPFVAEPIIASRSHQIAMEIIGLAAVRM
ncbi:MAG: inositol monophosphatase [Planctomycetota bacterium]